MGIFTKRTAVCIECGNEFKTSSEMPLLCNNCHKKNLTTKDKVLGYINYRKRAILKGLTSNELRAIPLYTKHILEKYIDKKDILENEIEDLKNKFNSFAIGASYINNFFTLNQYEYTVIDCQDIIAIGHRMDIIITEAGQYAFFVLFTNDPYIPVFPLAFKVNCNDSKSEEFQQLISLLKSVCPNLVHPISDLENIKILFKKEYDLFGNIDESFMIDKIIEAAGNYGLFNMQRLNSDIPLKSVELFKEYGYIFDM